jgi:hypothetical protein
MTSPLRNMAGPDGKLLKCTHRRKSTGGLYRIVEMGIFDLYTGQQVYIIANHEGYTFALHAHRWDHDFEYVPGGQ